MPLFFLGAEACDCCMGQSRLQSDPGSGFCQLLSTEHPVGARHLPGVRDLSSVLVFPYYKGKKKLIRLSLCVNETKSASYSFSFVHGLSI